MKYYLRGKERDNISLYSFDDETGELYQMQDGKDKMKGMRWDIEYTYGEYELGGAWWCNYDWEVLLPQFVFVEML